MLSLQSPLLQYSLNSCHIFAVDGADAVVEVQVAQRKTLARVAARAVVVMAARRISSEDGLVVSSVFLKSKKKRSKDFPSIHLVFVVALFCLLSLEMQSRSE